MNADLQAAGVIAVIEFGATARGDADAHSDRDIFLLIENAEPAIIAKLRQTAAIELNTSASAVACYTVSTVDRMLELGSLFLWHLRLEGRILFDPDGVAAEALAALRPYDNLHTDLSRFRGVYADVEDSFRALGYLNAFESHVLFGIVRNTCMLLTVIAGSPRFGRGVVLGEARRLYPDVPLSTEVFNLLETGHLVYHRGAKLPWGTISGQQSEAVMREVKLLLDFAVAQTSDTEVTTRSDSSLRSAVALIAKGRRPSYRGRLQIERLVFTFLADCLAKNVALDIQHVDADLLNTVACIDTDEAVPTRTLFCATTAVRAIALLRDLASFDPYVVADFEDASVVVRPPSEILELYNAVQTLQSLHEMRILEIHQ